MTEDDDLVAPAEIARRIGISVQAVHLLAAREDFPAPAIVVPGKRTFRAWKWDEVRDWYNNRPRRVSQAE